MVLVPAPEVGQILTQPGGQPIVISTHEKQALTMISAELFKDYLREKYYEEFRESFDKMTVLNKSLVNK